MGGAGPGGALGGAWVWCEGVLRHTLSHFALCSSDRLSSQLVRLKIPHPGRVIGQLVMKLTMPGVLGWVLGGNTDRIERSRAGQCRLADQPHAFSERQFPEFMRDDEVRGGPMGCGLSHRG